jgi:uncharacterized membrane protein YphA (DoxX/SURF4 family)
MEKIAKSGQCFFAAAIIAFGVENFICAHTGHVVNGVPWFPETRWLAYLTGIALLTAGFSIVANVGIRLWATLLGIFFLLLMLVREIPAAAAQPLDLSIRTVVFEALSMGASALLLAGIAPQDTILLSGWERIINALIKCAPYFLAISSIAFGITHFLILPFIASLITPWIPFKMFWAWFTGAGFIAAGLSIASGLFARWGAFFLGLMFLLWFLLLHMVRILGNGARFHNADEWSSAFIALGLCGGCWMCAKYLTPSMSSRHNF